MVQKSPKDGRKSKRLFQLVLSVNVRPTVYYHETFFLFLGMLRYKELAEAAKAKKLAMAKAKKMAS